MERKSDWNYPDGSSYYSDDWNSYYDDFDADEDDDYENYEFNVEYDIESDTYSVTMRNWNTDKDVEGCCELDGDLNVIYSDFPATINEICINEARYYSK